MIVETHPVEQHLQELQQQLLLRPAIVQLRHGMGVVFIVILVRDRITVIWGINLLLLKLKGTMFTVGLEVVGIIVVVLLIQIVVIKLQQLALVHHLLMDHILGRVRIRSEECRGFGMVSSLWP